MRHLRGGVAALKSGLEKCLPGDLLVIQPDSVDDAVEFLSTLVPECFCASPFLLVLVRANVHYAITQWAGKPRLCQ